MGDAGHGALGSDTVRQKFARRYMRSVSWRSKMAKWTVAAVAVLLTIGIATAAMATGRQFEPDYPMSKQYVAVSVYKILRDVAPETLADCAADVKQEPSRFADIGGAGAFTQGAINCLDKLGMLEDLPGGSGNALSGTTTSGTSSSTSDQSEPSRRTTGSCTHWHAGAPKHTHVRYSDGKVSGHSHVPSSRTKCGYLWQ